MERKNVELFTENLETAEEILAKVFNELPKIDLSDSKDHRWGSKELQIQSQTLIEIDRAVKSLNGSMHKINEILTKLLVSRE